MDESKDIHANVLNFAEVEDKFPTTYIPSESFMIRLLDHILIFKYRGMIYIADWENQAAYTNMVYTKTKELWAKRAYELLHTSGYRYPSMTEAIYLV